MKKKIICWKITNEMSGESWNFINLTEAEAQELYLAFLEGEIEDTIMEAQMYEYLGIDSGWFDANWLFKDYNEEVDRLLLLDGEYSMYRRKIEYFDFKEDAK